MPFISSPTLNFTTMIRNRETVQQICGGEFLCLGYISVSNGSTVFYSDSNQSDGTQANGSYDNIVDGDPNTTWGFEKLGTPTDEEVGFTVSYDPGTPIDNEILKTLTISAEDGYDIGDFELWGHPTHSQVYDWASNNPTYATDTGWQQITSSTSNSVDPDAPDIISFSNNNVSYNTYLILFKDAGDHRITELNFYKEAVPTFSLSAFPTTIVEGSSFVVTLTTENLPDGELIEYEVTGDFAPEDFTQGGTGIGYFDVQNNTDNFTIGIVSNALNVNDQTITITLTNGEDTLDVIVQNNPNNDE